MIKGNTYLGLICVFVALGGFLSGFDMAVLSGTIHVTAKMTSPNNLHEHGAMMSSWVACLFGAGISGWFADKYGRRTVLRMSGFLYVMLAVGRLFVLPMPILVSWSAIGGAAVGCTAVLVPVYISEFSPPHVRGRKVAGFQLMVAGGILLSYICSGLWFHHDHTAHMMNASSSGLSWPLLLSSNLLPAIIHLGLLFYIPESPRWLIFRGRNREALAIFDRIDGAADEIESMEMVNGIKRELPGFSQLLAFPLRRAMIAGVVLAVFSQLTGISTVMYYAPGILANTGFIGDPVLGTALLIGCFNMAFVALTVWKIDAWGRRTLLRFGFAAMAVSLLVIAACFAASPDLQGMLFAALIFYTCVFAATICPCVWVFMAEIFPTRLRARAMSLCAFAFFLTASFVSNYHMMACEAWGNWVVFLLLAFFAAIASWLTYKLVPETAKRPLEEIVLAWPDARPTAEGITVFTVEV